MQLIPCYSTAIGTFIFDSRLGLLDDPPRDEPERFVKATQDFLHYTQELRSGPPFYKIMETPAWKGFCKASDFLIEAGKKYVEEKEKQLSERAAKEVDIPDKRGSLLEHMFTKGELAPEEIIIQATELLMGEWILRPKRVNGLCTFWQKHPDIQQKLYSEIASVLNADEPVTADQLVESSISESMSKRSYKIVPFYICKTIESLSKDLVLGGYLVPAGTIVQMNLYIQGRSELYFKNATQFQPERWLRDAGKHFHPFASLPFGFGPRMCPGMDGK
ncbi:hypothetical protein OS493_039671 [Desmophyllum pertusum]|uniref:Cytochrome P450 n=1 Tax=Desmophyllum pertusum TaxID=174260 RepID=A0A9X0CVD4_9CNID|nr:hypothetical protein OS493_039671 [Desmophyllum pertusum]